MRLPNGKGQVGHTAFREAPHRCNKSLLCGQIRSKPVCVHHLEQAFPASVPSECLPHPLPFAGLSHTALSTLLPTSPTPCPPPSQAPSHSKSIWRTCVCSIPASDFGPPVPPSTSCWAGGQDTPGAAGTPAAVPPAAIGPSYLQVNCRFSPFLLQHFIGAGTCPVL